MATWSDLIEHVRESYELTEDADGHFALTWEFEHDGVTDAQPLVGHRIVDDHKVWLELCATIVGAHQLSPEVALERNDRLLRGMICKRDGRLLLRLVVDLDWVTSASIDETLVEFGRQAVRLRMQPLVAPAPEAFAFWGQ
jgi:hypothetical protein